MSKKTKTVYNLEDETVIIKIDAKARDYLYKHEENPEILNRTPKHQVYHQTTNNKAFKQPDKPQLYPVSVTVEKIEKQRKSSLSSRAESNKSASSKQPQFLEDDEEPSYSTGKEYDQDSSRNSSNDSKSTKSSSSNEKERISVVSEGTRSFEDDEENTVANSFKNQDKTEVLSVSNIEIAHYPFKYSERSPSLLPPPPRNHNESDRLPFQTENRPILMNASVTSAGVVSASNSESTISVFDINNASLPLQPRDHGNHCAIEVSVLEKHKDGCTNTRKEIVGRNIEDKVGSYDVVSRMVYRTCGPDKKVIAAHIKNSLKSYHLNNPEFFGKNLQETRSRVETIPILPNYKCVLNADFPKTEKTFGEISGNKRTSIESKTEPHVTENLRTFNPPPEVLSVYIRTDRSEKVPEGFEKMHFRGDSCKLHDPEERTKQILQLQKVIEETSSEAYLSKSPRQFGSVNDPHVMPATAVADNPMPLQAAIGPQITLASDSEEETDGSTVSFPPENPEENQENYDDEDLDELPTNDIKESDEIMSAGFFNCFRRNKQKRQREASIEFVRDFSGKRVTHSNNQPRRNTEEDVGKSHKRKLSAQYRR